MTVSALFSYFCTEPLHPRFPFLFRFGKDKGISVLQLFFKKVNVCGNVLSAENKPPEERI